MSEPFAGWFHFFTSPRRRFPLLQVLNVRGVLLIAKFGRLARNVAVDMPEADTLTIDVMAAVAEREAQLISARTKAALGARKARGLRLGRPANLTPEARQAEATIGRAWAVRDISTVAAYAGALRGQGLSLRAI